MTHCLEEGERLQDQPQEDEIALVGAQALRALWAQGQSQALRTDFQAIPPQTQNEYPLLAVEECAELNM